MPYHQYWDNLGFEILRFVENYYVRMSMAWYRHGCMISTGDINSKGVNFIPLMHLLSFPTGACPQFNK